MVHDIPESETQERLAQLNQELIDSELITPDHVYADIDLFKDFRLGTILSFVADHENPSQAYQYMLNQLTTYKAFKFLNPVSCFPELKIAPAAFLQRLRDPAWSDRLFHLSPMTGFLNTYKKQLEINANHSQVREKYTKLPIGLAKHVRDYDAITLYLNTHPYTFSQPVIASLAQFITEAFGIHVTLLPMKPADIPPTLCDQFQEFYTAHLDHLLENQHLNTSFSQMKHHAQYVFARFLFDQDDHQKFTQNHLNSEMAHVAARMDVLCHFKWLDEAAYLPLAKKEIIPAQDPPA